MNAELARSRPTEIRLSPNGQTIYAADRDGFLRVYSSRTGELINSWKVGQSLGGMDISPDGSFLAVVERNLSTTYRVDTATGTRTSYVYAPGGYEGLLFDVAILSDGSALFSQNFNGSGWVTLKRLDYSTGTYTAGQTTSQSSVFSRSETGTVVLIGEPNNSAGPLAMYRTGQGIVANASSNGYNWGIQAFSGVLAAQYIYNEGVNIYDVNLKKQVTLTTWNYGAVSDLTFSVDSKWLYVMDNKTNSIIKVDTANWEIAGTFAVGVPVGTWAGQIGASNGSRLILDPGQRFFSVATDTGLVVVANPDAPAINGTAGDESLSGALFDDVLNGLAGNDSLSGFAGADTLLGGAGNDTLDGGAGVDRLTGGPGDDRMLVDDVGDLVVEAAGEGIDTVIVGATAGIASYSIAAGAEVELLQAATGNAAINITGNGFAQRIEGNAGNNILNGGGGFDTLVGLDGDDQYLVRELGSVVIEANGGGRDTVFTTVSYNLGVNEVEVLSTVTNAETTAIDLIGNFATQTVVGNYGNNVLNGGSGGNDTLIGLRGNDVYAVGSQTIRIVEADGEGADTLVAFADYQIRNGVSIEVFAAQNRAGTDPLTLRGNEVAQTIVGNAGNNVLDGRGGSDALVGDAGADTFAFTTALGAGNVDTILDFVSGTDKIGLASDIFAALGGSVSAGNLALGTAAADGDDRLVYDQASGRLFYDADGNGAGAAVQFAQLAAGTALSAGDFVIVAPVSDLPA